MEIHQKASRVYANILERCYSEKNKQFNDYGGRGIFVDEKWINDPTSFFNWYKRNYFVSGQVDRIDNDGPYAGWNCKFSTREENGRNKRNNVIITAWGESKTANDWICDNRAAVGITYNCLIKRVTNGWPHEEAIITPPSYSTRRSPVNKNGNLLGQMPDVEKLTAFGESKTLHEWSKDPRCVVDKNTLWYRKSKGWDVEKAIITSPAKNAGQLYEGRSVLQWSKDPRCQVSYKVLNSRLKKGIMLDTALKA